MSREAKDVTGAELRVLQILWDRGTASIRQITDALHPAGGAARYATVQKQLERLEAKGYVRRDRSLFVHLFSATVGRDELVGRRLREVADKLCGGSLAPILSHLSRMKPLTEPERQALRELIERPAPAGNSPDTRREANASKISKKRAQGDGGRKERP